jgi:predicted DCC family thiol-disulfide oxidoreductase YuxK
MQQDLEIIDALKPTVFYDGSCPLCGREIAHYRRLRGSEKLRWVDIAQDNATLSTFGLDKELAMARFHVMDAKGCWQKGAYGFVEMWSHLPVYRWLAFTVRALRLSSLLDRAYNRFARWRSRRNCSATQCQPGGQRLE